MDGGWLRVRGIRETSKKRAVCGRRLIIQYARNYHKGTETNRE